MTSSGLASIFVGAGAGLALAASPAQPHPISGRPAAIEAAVVLKGKICRTRTGASFSFGAARIRAVEPGGVLYIEETAVACSAG